MYDTDEPAVWISICENPELFDLIFSRTDASSLGRLAQTCRFARAGADEVARLQVSRQWPWIQVSSGQWGRTLASLEFSRLSPQLTTSSNDGVSTITFLLHACVEEISSEHSSVSTYIYTAPKYDTYYSACSTSLDSSIAAKQYVEFTVVKAPSNMYTDLDPFYELQVGLAPRDLDVNDQVPKMEAGSYAAGYLQDHPSWGPPRPVDKSTKYWGIQWHNGSDYNGDNATTGFLLHSSEDVQSLWSSHGRIDADTGIWDDHPDVDDDEGTLGFLSSSCWCTAWQPNQNLGQRLGLLWDAEAGNLTVFENGRRIGFANSKRWIEEIKGDLGWSITITQLQNGMEWLESIPNDDISVQVTHRPVPVLTAAEAAAEQVELTQMAALKAQRKVLTDAIAEDRENPKCAGCHRPWTQLQEHQCHCERWVCKECHAA